MPEGHLVDHLLAPLGEEKYEHRGANGHPDAEGGLFGLNLDLLVRLLAHVLREETGRDVCALLKFLDFFFGTVRWIY